MKYFDLLVSRNLQFSILPFFLVNPPSNPILEKHIKQERDPFRRMNSERVRLEHLYRLLRLCSSIFLV